MTAKRTSALLPPLWVILALVIAGMVWLLIQLKEVCFLIIAGYLIAYILEPVLAALERKKIPRPLGLLGVAVLAIAVLFLFGATAYPTISKEYNALVSGLPGYYNTAREQFGPKLLELKNRLPVDILPEETLRSMIGNLPSMGAEAGQKVLKKIGETLLEGYSVGLTLLNLFLLPFIVYYLAVDFRQTHQRFMDVVPIASRRKVLGVFREIDAGLSAFFRGQFIVGCVDFVLYALGLGMLGVELWPILAVISGFGSIIPYVGFISGIILSTIMALVTFQDLSHVLWVWAVYFVVQFIEGTFVVPKVVGNKVGLSPLAVTLVIFAGGKLFGILGIFLAVPAATIFKVLARHFYAWALVHR